MSRVPDATAPTLAAGISGDSSGGADSLDARPLLAGRYRIVERLGAGAMGTVYRAHDVELDEEVALKALRRELVDAPGALDRFRREVKLARRVTHRGVARTFDLGEHEGEKFLTMELVLGPSLGLRLRQDRALPPAEAVRIGTRIAEALGAAHAAGVVHRDLKPDNVLLASDGRVVVTDFGVARAVAESDARATLAGGIVGTPAYMAPEQVEGAAVDARTDLFALGVVLFEMLTGELPFEGESALAMAAARLVKPARDVTAVKPGLPAALVELVRRCLSRAPSARPVDAAEVERALALCAQDASLAAASTAPARASAHPPARDALETRLAVIPIRASTDDARWIADGLTEDLIDALSMARGVRVRARPEALPAGESLESYARRLDVDVLVEGQVRPVGDRVRVTVRLVSPRDGFQVWAQRFDASVGELLRASDEAAHAIAEALAGAQLTAAPRAAVSAEVTELYLRAQQEWRRSELGSDRGLAHMRRAVELAPDDPTILSAYAIRLAHGAAYGMYVDPVETARAVAGAKAAAERALALGPHLPDAYVALARIEWLHGDLVASVRSLFRAKDRGPSIADVDDLLGRILAEHDLLPEAHAHLERALWLDPDLHHARIDLVRTLALEGRYDELDVQLDTLAARSPLFHHLIANRVARWRGLVAGNVVSPPPPGAPSLWNEVHELTLRVAEAVRFDRDDATALQDALARMPSVRLRRLYCQIVAELFTAKGSPEFALRALAAAADAGLVDVAWLRRCPLIADLRDAREYRAALAVVEARTQPVVEAYREEVAARQ